MYESGTDAYVAALREATETWFPSDKPVKRRDVSRIPAVLAELEEYWSKPEHQDMRLAQIIGNLSQLNDPYNYEDTSLLAALRAENGKEQGSGNRTR